MGVIGHLGVLTGFGVSGCVHFSGRARDGCMGGADWMWALQCKAARGAGMCPTRESAKNHENIKINTIILSLSRPFPLTNTYISFLSSFFFPVYSPLILGPAFSYDSFSLPYSLASFLSSPFLTLSLLLTLLPLSLFILPLPLTSPLPPSPTLISPPPPL